ncbi:MAG: response regulator [Nitrospiraceae bacterium]|nr:response regulator [Nitrospiraceae bacterium]
MTEKGKILVLDDDPAVGLSCGRILGAEGYAVDAVETGAEALRRLAAEEFDLLIADIRLPDIDGIEVLREARTIQPATDVVMITGYPRLEDAKEAIRLGAFEYLEKPFAPEFMRNIAARLFDKRGWILRKGFIDQFRQYIVPASDLDDQAVYYRDGAWARPVDGGWEIGFDIRKRYLGRGNLFYMDMIEQPAITSGEPFARVLLGEDRIIELMAPMSGVIKQRNDKVNETLSGFASECLSENWLVWLLRIEPGQPQDLKEVLKKRHDC